MNMNMTNKVNCDKVEQANHIVNKLNPDRNVTEEEFQNFMHRVTEVGKYDTQLCCKFISINKILHSRKNCKEVSIFRSKGARMREKVSG